MSRAKDVEIVAEAKRTGEDHHPRFGLWSSVVILRLRDLRTDEIISRFDAVWNEIESPLMGGAIVSLSDKSLRIRNLPIEPE